MAVCALCKEDRKLNSSHLLPASIFRAISTGYHPDSTPVLMDGFKNKTLKTNKQFIKKLLCDDCEDRFNKNGERIVTSQMYLNRSAFTLRDQLLLTPADYNSDYGPVYFSKSVLSMINGNAYSYFAISVLWRGSSTRWDQLADYYFNALGSVYESAFADYLLGRISFPNNTYVAVLFDPDEEPITLTTLPMAARSDHTEATCRLHSFYIPGIKFIVFVGGKIQRDLQKVYDAADSKIVFISSKFAGSPTHKQAINDAKNNQVVGKLAREWSE